MLFKIFDGPMSDCAKVILKIDQKVIKRIINMDDKQFFHYSLFINVQLL